MRTSVPFPSAGRPAPAACIVLLSTVAAASLCAVPATAQAGGARAQRIVVQADAPLGAVLQRIQSETGTKITYDPDIVEGLRSKRVRGAKTAREAVIAAIAGTSLAVRVRDDGSILVIGTAASESGDILVIAKRDEAETNYNVNKATSSTRTGQTLKDIPQSTAVISDRLIRDQQAQTVLDAMKNAGGIAPLLGLGGGPPGFLVRGYSGQALSNGLSSPAAANAPVAAVERIEVIRGPVAILSGEASFGGTVNIVPKKPTASPLLNVALEYQSFNDKKVTIDASNAITADRSISARVIGQYEDSGQGPGGYDGRYERLFAPSLRFKNSVADITVGINTSKVYAPRMQSTVYDNVAKRPRTDVYSPLGARDQGARIDSTRYFTDSSFTPAPWLTLVARGELYRIGQNFRYQALYGAPDAAGNNFGADEVGAQKDAGKALDTYARFKFKTGPVRHTVITGMNYTDVTRTSYVAETRYFDVNIFRPAVSPPAAQLQALPNAILDATTTAFYIQDLIEVGPVHLSGALRHARFKSDQISPLYGNPPSSEKATSTLPSFGAVLDVTSNVSIYGNYLKGYAPITLLDCEGNKVPDLQSRNMEGGVKADLFGRNLSIVASLYDIRTNVRYDYAPPPCRANRYNVVRSGQVNRGVELTATGSPMRGLNINASYSYQKMSYVNPIVIPGFPEFSDAVIPGVANHSYSLFAAYEQPSPDRIKLGGAIGLYGNSRYFANGGGTKPVPGGAQIDTNVYVNFGRTRLNVGVRNVFDKLLYLPATVDFYIPLRERRRVIVTLSHAFF